MKKVIMILVLLISIFVFGGCSLIDDDDDYLLSDSDDYLLLKANNKLEFNYSEYQQKEYIDFSKKLAKFGSKLSSEVYMKFLEEENVTISPISIYMALAMTVEATSGESREEILRALDMTYEEVSNYTKKLYSLCNQEFEYYYSQFTDNKKISAYELLTNSIWIDENVNLKDNSLERLANNYNCNSFKVPFKMNNKVANGAVRDFVKDNTKGLIDRKFQLTEETVFALINTFYLKEIWNEDGDELKLTKEKYEFKTSDGSVKNINLLTGYYNNGKVYEEESFKHFFTTTNHNFKISFIVPKDGYSVSDVFIEENIYNINNIKDYLYDDKINKEYNHTRVLFPEFEGSFNEDISSVLKDKFNISSIFDINKSDFSPISDSDLFATGVIHQTELVVNRKGIEGAAITIIPTAGAAGPNEEYKDVYYDFVIDREFGFVITDYYGNYLFAGVINNI